MLCDVLHSDERRKVKQFCLRYFYFKTVRFLFPNLYFMQNSEPGRVKAFMLQCRSIGRVNQTYRWYLTYLLGVLVVGLPEGCLLCQAEDSDYKNHVNDEGLHGRIVYVSEFWLKIQSCKFSNLLNKLIATLWFIPCGQDRIMGYDMDFKSRRMC
jgi:hypothetical protein